MAQERDITVTLKLDISEFVKAAQQMAHLLNNCPYCTLPEGWDACPVHRDHP